MTREEMVLYLANMISISGVDKEISSNEGEAIESVRQEIGASESDLKKALNAVAGGGFRITPIGRFSDKVRNLEDMFFTAISDGDISKSEKPELLAFAKELKITQGQLSEILSESKVRFKSQKPTKTCSSCRKEIPPESKFCPKCGVNV